MTKSRIKIHASVRYGGAVYMAGNEDHADMLVEALNGRSCRRLLTAGAISGKAFEDKAKKWEKDNADAAKAAAEVDALKQARRDAAAPWAHAPGDGNTVSNTKSEVPAADEGGEE